MNDEAYILLVDDQDRNLDALEAILEPTGYPLVRARSADEALLALLRSDFAAIVCDIRMPGTGGIELAQMIKQRKRSQHIPIVFLTAHTIEEEELLRGYSVGAVDYLSKPINPAVLRLKVGVFVELFRKTRALAAEIAQRQAAEEALRIARDELEQRVQERTAELLAANRALRESEDRMVTAMQGAAMEVFSHELRTGRVLWSVALETTFGMQPGAFEGTFEAFLQRVHPDDRARIVTEVEVAAQTRQPFTLEFRFRRENDRPGAFERWMSTASRFVMDESGRPVHCVGVNSDVTSQRQAAEELRSLKEAAENANRAKDLFLAVLSHELRTPLTPVLATVQELCRSNDLDDNLRESLDLVYRNVELEARLIDDLLDLTRISRGKMELHRSRVDVHQVLGHALRTCEADFSAKSITLRASLRAKNTQVIADRARLTQVFWNLLKNAAKFTAAGRSVEVSTFDAPDDQIQIEVRDTGIGIDPARLQTIFDAFEQGNATVTRQYGGLGLGLAIAKALVGMHGGKILAASEGLGQGACFTVILPSQMTIEEKAGIPADRSAVPVGSSVGRSTVPHRLLLIEDHLDTCKVMERILSRAGYDVSVAQGVADALRVCQAAPSPFDIVVSDLGLPDGSGLDFMRQFRVRYPRVPAIALSGFGMEDDRVRSLDAGFKAHLTKPVDLVSLRAKIEEVIAEQVA